MSLSFQLSCLAIIKLFFLSFYFQEMTPKNQPTVKSKHIRLLQIAFQAVNSIVFYNAEKKITCILTSSQVPSDIKFCIL